MAGLSTTGLTIKTYDEVKAELVADLRTYLGNGVNTLETGLLGKIKAIISERETLVWEVLESLYNMYDPDSAEGVLLDKIVALTGFTRLEATYSTATVTVYGTNGTTVPEDTIFSVDGNPDVQFGTDAAAIIGNGVDEVQTITFDSVPDGGEFKLVFDGDETNAILYSDNAATVESELNGLPSLSAVTVTGNFSTGFVVTFTGSDGEQDQELLTTVDNTLELSAVSVSISVAETTQGVLPNVDIECTALVAGALEAAAGSLTVIDTPVSGLNSVTNSLDATVGSDIETDSELRIRREASLAAFGKSTKVGIRQKILALDDVAACVVYTNRDDTTDSSGRPPHSCEVVVLGGTDEDISNELNENFPAGITYYGSTTVSLEDSQGFSEDIKFSRPTEIDVYLEVDLRTNTDFPDASGPASLKTQIVDYAEENFSIGDDAIVFGTLSIAGALSQTGGVIGITDYDIRISTASTALVQTLTFDADLVASNVVSYMLSGVAGTSTVTYATSHAATMTALAAQLQSESLIVTATVTGTREITITSQTAGVPAVLHDVEVANGASQASTEIKTTSHSDDNIAIESNQISAWDSSRVVITVLS